MPTTGAVTLKDADELADAVAHGEVSAAEAENAHHRCAELAELAGERAGIFGEPWPTWCPDPDWSAPRLSPVAVATLGASPTPADHHLDLAWWLDGRSAR